MTLPETPSCSPGFTNVNGTCVEECASDYVRDKNGVCRKKNGVCLPEDVQKNPSLNQGICYLQFKSKPGDRCSFQQEIYQYNMDEWFRDGDYAAWQYKGITPNSGDETYGCEERARGLMDYCDLEELPTHKTIAPDAYAYNPDTGECEKTGCIDTWPRAFVQDSDGNCKNEYVV